MDKTNLRKIFVQLLFSLAIGQVGIRIGQLVVIEAPFKKYCYSYFHLFLCVVIITSSWVGWHKSKSKHNSDSIESVISLQYLILLADMFLVICYFIIVNGAEVNLNLTTIPPASSHIEVLWSMIIFGTYLVWDCLTKIIVFNYTLENESLTLISKIGLTKSFPKRIYITVFCFLVSFIFYLSMSDESDEYLVCLIDGTLIALFIAFRGLKQDIVKSYNVNEEQISAEELEFLKSKGAHFPTVAYESKTMSNVKFTLTKIIPVATMLATYIIYLCLR